MVSFGAGTGRFGAAAASRCGEAVDDGEQVLFDGAVHFGEALLAVSVGLLDQGPGLIELTMVLGQEFGGSDEDGASQTRVGVLAALLQRQGAVSVGQGHFRASQVVFHPDRFGQRAGIAAELFASDVDFAGTVPLLPNGLIRQSRIARGHLMRGVFDIRVI